jgi:hypothetical protein
MGGCSFTDLDGFTGGDAGAVPPDSSTQVDAASTEEPPVVGDACGDNRYCALAPPQGWSFVAVRFGEGGDCPTGYGNGADLVEMASGTGSSSLCGCSCGEPMGSASCTNGNARFEWYSSFVCFGGNTTNIPGTCTPVNIKLGLSFGDDFVSVATVPPTQVACSSTMQNAKPPPPVTSPARSCALVEEARTEGCSQDRRCITAPKDGYSLCLARRQRNATCPRGYGRRRALGASIQDTRTCESCRCETTGSCSNPRVELFTTSDCTNTPTTIAAGTACKSSGARGTFTSARYQADLVSGGCKLVDEVIEGSLSLTDEITVCCPSGAGG